MSRDEIRDPAQLERQIVEAEWRRRLVKAGGFDPESLTEQGQRILRWLTKWDDWTIGGLVEILDATRMAAPVADVEELDGRREAGR